MSQSTFTPTSTGEHVPLLVGGEWRQSSTDRFSDIYNPSQGKVIGRTPLCQADEVSHVVDVAAAALDDWGNTPVVDRARLMFQFHALFDQHFDELAELITRNMERRMARPRRRSNGASK